VSRFQEPVPEHATPRARLAGGEREIRSLRYRFLCGDFPRELGSGTDAAADELPLFRRSVAPDATG
jgi:hypothetical protein